METIFDAAAMFLPLAAKRNITSQPPSVKYIVLIANLGLKRIFFCGHSHNQVLPNDKVNTTK